MTELLFREPAATADTPDPGIDPGDPGDPGGSGVDEELLCVDAVSVTHDVRSFVLEAPRSPGFGFRPGQYLTVSLDIDGRPMERCYTIASSPTRPRLITLTVKRVPGGPVSNWLHDHLGAGDRLHVRGPIGRFTMLDHPSPRYLFLSAGSGITPLMSMTRALQDLPGPRDVAFVHSARTPRDIIFREELAALERVGGWLSVTTVCEEDSPDQTWTGHRGRLSGRVLRSAVPDLTEREIFTCGPEPYMRAVRELLAEARVDPARCHEESFALAGSAPGAYDAGPGQTLDVGFAVEFRRSGRMVHCEPGRTVLDAALRAGVNLPFSCAEGMCGTCKSTLLDGEVEMHHAGGIRPREIAENKFLPCCSTPLGDLVVDA